MPSNIEFNLIYSEFDEKVGPVPRYTFPETEKSLATSVARKGIDILSEDPEHMSNALAFLPFPSMKKKAIVKSFEWTDEDLRGGIGTATITLLFDEADDLIFYKYVKDLEVLFIEITDEVIEIKNVKSDMNVVSEKIKNAHGLITKRLRELENLEQKGLEAFPDEVDTDEKFTFKVSVVGDPACGKTSTILRYTDSAFRRTYLPTIGVNITKKKVKKRNDVTLILWDIAGHLKFSQMRKTFYEGTKAILLIFDLTRLDTFEDIQGWFNDVRKYLPNDPNLITLLCGNKKDLIKQRKISFEQGHELANKLNVDYFETSALTGENIDEIFSKLAEKLIETMNGTKKKVIHKLF